MSNSALQIESAIKRLHNWFERNGFEGWDPYDIQDSKIFRLIEKRFPLLISKISIRFLSEIAHFFPNSFRRFALVDRVVNNKGLGLMLAAYSSYYAITKSPKYLKKATELSEVLIQNTNKEYSGMSWGYPFDWLSAILIPAGTPSSVVTSIVGDGFYRLYKATNDEKHLNICRNVCLFFLENLNISFENKNQTVWCYSYTPIDDYQVHNANLFVAEFLIRVGNEVNNQSYIDAGLSCARFALIEQQKEGYLPYWGLAQTNKYSGGRLHTDHYHCGFEIRSLHAIWLHTKIDAFYSSYRSYYLWYKKNMFNPDGMPKYTTKNMYPLNIHTCAEAILCNVQLAESEEDLGFAIDLTKDIIQKMEFRSGEYTHVIREVLPFVKVKSNIALLRWGQAWMFLALVELYDSLMNP